MLPLAQRFLRVRSSGAAKAVVGRARVAVKEALLEAGNRQDSDSGGSTPPGERPRDEFFTPHGDDDELEEPSPGGVFRRGVLPRRSQRLRGASIVPSPSPSGSRPTPLGGPRETPISHAHPPAGEAPPESPAPPSWTWGVVRRLFGGGR